MVHARPCEKKQQSAGMVHNADCIEVRPKSNHALCRQERTSQQLKRASTELDQARRDSLDKTEQLNRSSAELKRSSTELIRIRALPAGSTLASLEEGSERTVQLVLQIISETASTGTLSVVRFSAGLLNAGKLFQTEVMLISHAGHR